MPKPPLTTHRPCWITSQECIVLHERMVLRYGGLAGVRDPAVLEATVAKPKEKFASGETGLGHLAACYATGIARGRPFASGNLASAFVLVATFLAANGFVFTGNELSVVMVILNLAEGHETEAEFAHYLRCNCDAV